MEKEKGLSPFVQPGSGGGDKECHVAGSLGAECHGDAECVLQQATGQLPLDGGLGDGGHTDMGHDIVLAEHVHAAHLAAAHVGPVDDGLGDAEVQLSGIHAIHSGAMGHHAMSTHDVVHGQLFQAGIPDVTLVDADELGGNAAGLPSLSDLDNGSAYAAPGSPDMPSHSSILKVDS